MLPIYSSHTRVVASTQLVAIRVHFSRIPNQHKPTILPDILYQNIPSSHNLIPKYLQLTDPAITYPQRGNPQPKHPKHTYALQKYPRFTCLHSKYPEFGHPAPNHHRTHLLTTQYPYLTSVLQIPWNQIPSAETLSTLLPSTSAHGFYTQIAAVHMTCTHVYVPARSYWYPDHSGTFETCYYVTIIDYIDITNSINITGYIYIYIYIYIYMLPFKAHINQHGGLLK